MPATDIERLVVQLSADVRGYQRSLDRARAITNKAAGDIETRFNRMNKNVNSQFSKLGSGFRNIPGLRGGIAGLGAALGARQVQQYADAWTEAGNKIAAAGQVAGRQGRSLEGINEIANRSRAGLSETATLYARLLQSTAGVAKSEEEVARATETVSKAFVAGGASAGEMSAGVLQLGQALGSGVLQGDELRSLRENAPLLARAIAQEFKTTVGGLKELGEEGALTSDRVFKAILKGTAEIEAAFAKTKPTIANGFKAVENAFIELIGAFDKGTGTTASLSKQLQGLAEIIKSVGTNSIVALKQWNEFMESGSTFANLLKTLNAPGQNFIDDLKQGENPFDRQFFFGGSDGGPLDEAKEKVKQLQAQLAFLMTRNDAPPASIEQVKKALAEAIILANQLQGVFDKTNRTRFGGPTTGPASGNLPTLVPPSEASPASTKEFDDAVDKFVKTVIDFESKGNVTAKNPLSSATGLGQFIESTWLDLFKRNFPDRAKNMSDATILALRNDAATSIALIKTYATENGNILKKAGVAVTEANLQLSHFLGPGGALKVLKAAPGTPVENVLGPEVIAANRGVLAGKTTDQVIAEANARAGLSGAIRDNNAALAELASSNNADIDAMKVKQAELGAVTEAQKIYARELELTNQLQQQGVPITAEVKAQIHEAAVAYGEQAQQLENVKLAQDQAAESAKALEDAQQQAAQTAQAVAGAFGSAFQGFISDLAHGKKLTDALRDALLKLGESLLNIALDNLLGGIGGGGGGIGGGGGGGILGSLFGGLFHSGGVAGQGGHGRRVPALAFAGAPRYHGGGFAGLQQGEVPAILKRGEIIFPNMDAVRNAVSRQGNGAGGAIVQNNTFVSPSWKAAERSQNQIARTAGASLDRVRRTL